MMSGGMVGGVFMWLGLVILIVFLIAIVGMVWANANRNGVRKNVGDESSQDILKKRYARGEITKEQFDEMMRSIT